MNAQNTAAAAIAVIVGGTAVPLPNDQILNRFTVNAANTIFTVPVTGTYLITYTIKTTAALLMSSRVLLNNAPMAGTIDAPAVATGQFSATRINTLTAGDTLELQLFGLLGTAVLQAGTGASLVVIRLA